MTSEPFWCASLMISAAGMVTPSRLEVCPKETSLTCGVEKFRIGVKVKGAVRLRGDDLEHGTLLAAQLLPGDEVGVVFLVGDEDDIAGFEGERVRHQVDTLGGIAGEDDLVLFGGVEEFCQADAGILHLLRHFGSHVVHAASAAGRVLPVILVHRVQHHLRAQALAGGIEIHCPAYRSGQGSRGEFFGCPLGQL